MHKRALKEHKVTPALNHTFSKNKSKNQEVKVLVMFVRSCVCVCLCLCLCLNVYVCVFICLCECVCVHMHVCTHASRFCLMYGQTNSFDTRANFKKFYFKLYNQLFCFDKE